MKVCLIVEGAYPYVNGGMSNWIQQLMLYMKGTDSGTAYKYSSQEGGDQEL